MRDMASILDRLDEERRAELIAMFEHRIRLLESLIKQLSSAPARPTHDPLASPDRSPP